MTLAREDASPGAEPVVRARDGWLAAVAEAQQLVRDAAHAGPRADPSALLERLVHSVSAIVDAPVAVAVPRDGRLVWWTASRDADVARGRPVDVDGTACGEAWRTGTVQHVPGAMAEPEPEAADLTGALTLRNLARSGADEAVLVVPLVHGADVLGILSLTAPAPGLVRPQRRARGAAPRAHGRVGPQPLPPRLRREHPGPAGGRVRPAAPPAPAPARQRPVNGVNGTAQRRRRRATVRPTAPPAPATVAIQALPVAAPSTAPASPGRRPRHPGPGPARHRPLGVGRGQRPLPLVAADRPPRRARARHGAERGGHPRRDHPGRPCPLRRRPARRRRRSRRRWRPAPARPRRRARSGTSSPGASRSAATDGELLGAWGAVVDLTSAEHDTGALRSSLAGLRAAQELTGVAVWEWHPDTGRLVWSPEMYRLLGLSAEELVPTLDRWHALVHPEDVDRVRRLDVAAREGAGTVETYRVVRPDGEVRYVQSWSTAVRRGRATASPRASTAPPSTSPARSATA